MTYKYIDGMVIPIPDLPDSTTSSKGILQLTSDLSGTATSPLVAKLQGNPVKNQGSLSSLQDGYVATWVNGDGYIEFIHNSVSSGSVVPGSSGQFFITNSTPASAWTSLVSLELTHGRFTAGGGVSDFKVVIGPRVTAETTQGAMWILPAATAPSDTNWLLYADTTNLVISGPSVAGNVDFAVGGSNIVQANATNFNLLSASTFQWASSVASPILVQAATSSGPGQTMTVSAQASSFLNAVGGNLNLFYGAGNGTGDTNTPARVVISDSASAHVETRIGGYPSSPTTWASVWFLPHATASTTGNLSIRGDGGSLVLNAPAGTMYFQEAGTTYATLTSVALSLSVTQLLFTETMASPTIYQAARTSDLATSFLKLKAQDAWNNVAATHTGGGDIWIEPGASSTANGFPGNVHVYLPSNGSAYRGKFWVDDAANGAVFAAGIDAQYGTPGIWVAHDATATILAATALALYGSVGGGFTALNASTNVGFMIGGPAGTQVGTYNATTWTLGNSAATATMVLATLAGPSNYVALESGILYFDAAVWHIRDASHAETMQLQLTNAGTNGFYLSGDQVSLMLSSGAAVRATDTLPASIQLALQAPFGTATTFTTANDVIVVVPASVGTGVKQGGFAMTYSGSKIVELGTIGNHVDLGSLWLGIGSPDGTNYALVGGATQTALNVPTGGTGYFEIGGSTITGSFTSTAWTLGNATTMTSMTVQTPITNGVYILLETFSLYLDQWGINIRDGAHNPAMAWSVSGTGANTLSFASGVTSVLLTQTTNTANAANANITIAPQAPWNNAGNTLGTTAGDVIISTPASVNSGVKRGGFQIQYSGTTLIRGGTYQGDTLYAGFWFLDAGLPGSANYGFVGNQNTTILNAPSGGLLQLNIASAYGIGLSGTTTQTFLSNANVSSLSAGTGAASAVYTLCGGNNIGVAVLSATGGAGTGNLSIVGSVQHTLRTSSTSFAIDTTTTDTVVTLTATQSVTLPTPTTGRALEFWINLTGGGAVDSTITFVRHASETINGVSASLVVGPFTAGSMSKLLCRSDGTNWFISS